MTQAPPPSRVRWALTALAVLAAACGGGSSSGRAAATTTTQVAVTRAPATTTTTVAATTTTLSFTEQRKEKLRRIGYDLLLRWNAAIEAGDIAAIEALFNPSCTDDCIQRATTGARERAAKGWRITGPAFEVEAVVVPEDSPLGSLALLTVVITGPGSPIVDAEGNIVDHGPEHGPLGIGVVLTEVGPDEWRLSEYYGLFLTDEVFDEVLAAGVPE